MSHNNKYYLKRLKSNNASTKPINTFFKSTTVRDDGSLEPTTSSSTLEPTTSTSLPEPTTSSSTPEPTTSTSLPESTTSSSTTSPSRSDSSLCGSKSTSKSNCDPSTSNNDDNKAPKPTQELGPKNTLATKYELHYEWLFFSFSKKGYCCKHCQVFFTDNSSNRSPFIFGTELGDHPIRKLESHQQSKAHQEAVAKNHSHSAVSSGSQQTIDSLVRKRETLKLETHRKYIGSLINTTYFVIKKQWALDSVHDVMYHLKRENCPNIEQYENLYPQFMYTSSSSVSDIVCAIDQMVEKDILDKIRMAKYIALLADESTDEANRAQFAILIRCFVGNKIDDHFVGIVNVIRTTAESLMDAIQEFLQSKGIDISKVLFNGFDGCNTMSGQNKGLQKRFRHVVPHCLYINCRSHRLALAVKHLMKFFPVLVSVDEALLSIYHLFDNSPQRFGVFKDVQESYAIRELVLVRAAATRWLSHGQACKRVIDRFVQIVDTLDELIERKREPEVIGIRDAITNKTTLFAIIVLCDLLDPVNFFCKYLQGSVDFSMVTIKLKDLIDTLHNLTEQFRATVNNTNVPLYMSRTAQLFEEVDERTVYTRRLRNVGVHTHHQMVEEVAVPMVLKLIAELEDAFRPSPVLAAFSIFNLSHLPETMVELIDYGNHEIRTLSSHYGEVQGDDFEGHRSQSPALFNKDAAIAEFSAFKPQMLMMKISILGGISWKTLTGSTDDDWIDRVSHLWTVTLLLVFAVIISSSQYVGDPIHCWCPAEFTGTYVAYTKNYCWISNTYYIPLESRIPRNIADRQKAEINYYQWVPLILVFMAFMFKAPNIMWHLLNTKSGINLSKLCEMTDNLHIGKPEERDKLVKDIGRYVDRWLRENRNYHRNFFVKMRQHFSNVLLFCCGKRDGYFLTGFYLFTKFTYCVNCVTQFFILNSFMGMDFGGYGFEVISHFRDHGEWKETPRFPRVTLCDFEIRQLQNIQRFTVQCVLPINLFNEKIFALIWFWLFLVSVLSFFNFTSWMFYMVFNHNKELFVRKYLRYTREISTSFDKKVARRFAMEYLREDGCFLLRIVGKNSTDIILSDLMRVLWVLYNAGTIKLKRQNNVQEDEMIEPTLTEDLLKETDRHHGNSNEIVRAPKDESMC